MRKVGGKRSNLYVAGRAFEYDVRDLLAEELGAAMMRAASSAGTSKADLIAFVPDGRILLVQCKKYDPKITPGEWNRLWEVAGWYAHLRDPFGEHPAVLPLVATKGPHGKPPTFYRLAAPKVPRAHTWPWFVYDVKHGRDIVEAGDPVGHGGRVPERAG